MDTDPMINTIDAILAKLPDAKKSGKDWSARCPAHEDKSPSLSIGEGDDGRVLLKCHVGCTVESICDAWGIKVSDLMPESDAPVKPRIVSAYDYRDESSNLVFQVVRFEPKDFRQRKPKDGGGWDWSVKGVRVLPYRLPELLVQPKRRVVVVEGEKDVDGLGRIGVIATCNAGGAGKWTAQHAAFLKGRHVVILPDNDDPGRNHGQQVAATLHGVAASVRVVELPGLPHKGDASDWLAGGGTVEDLKRLTEAAAEWTPEAELKPAHATSRAVIKTKPEASVTTLLLATEKYIQTVADGQASLIDTGIPELDYALGGGIEQGEFLVFAARPSHGKSMVGLQCVHTWTGDGVPCLIISEEMSSLMLGKRTLQYLTKEPQEHWRTSMSEIGADFKEHFENRAECYIAERCGTVEEATRQIAVHVAEKGVKRVVVDYAQLLKSDGGSKYEQTSNMSIALRQCASRHGIILLALCQLSRAVENRKGGFVPTMSDIRDSGQIEQDADVIAGLCWPHRNNPKTPAEQYQIFVLKNRNRAINQSIIECRIRPSRQKLEVSQAKAVKQYNEFERFNGREPEQAQMGEDEGFA